MQMHLFSKIVLNGSKDMCITWVEKWCMTAMEIQASKEAECKGSMRASDTNTWKPLSAQI